MFRPFNWLSPLFLLIVLFVSFASNSQQVNREAVSTRVSDSNVHGLMVERINRIQSSIEQLLYQQNRTQSEIEQSRRNSIREIATAAIELRDSVETLVLLEPTLNLSPENSTAFLSFAQQLRVNSQALADLATGNQVGNLSEVVMRLQESCNSCHTLYRE